MGIMDTDRTLPANTLIFEVRRDPRLVERFATDLEGLMSDYGLSDREKKALREIDLKTLAELGLHPYFLPQVSRLIEGGAYHHNDSPAARLYAKKLLAG